MKKLDKYQRACQVWGILTCAASNSRLITYNVIRESIGVRSRRAIGVYLWLVKCYCEAKRLPEITSIVVDGQTGEPKVHFDNWPRKVRNTFLCEWFGKKVPTPDDFADSEKPLKAG